MLTLVSYPGLFGLADNNAYGLKVFAFLKLCALPFRHEHRSSPEGAPRNQLPFIADGDETVGDSDLIIAHLIRRFALTVDDARPREAGPTNLMIRRTLDDLYWVMSYSRWQDPRFYPSFRDAFVSAYPTVSADALEGARAYNAQRYYYQGIGRYAPEEVYARGIADLTALEEILPERGFAFGPKPTSTDAGLYGFVANILFYAIDTPLKSFLLTRPRLVRHCREMHARVAG